MYRQIPGIMNIIMNIKMKRIYLALLSPLLLMAGGCADDFFSPSASETADGTTVEAYLSLTVNELSVATGGSRAAEPSDIPEVVTDDEKRIDDIWVFQYSAASGNQIINAAYYEIGNQEELNNLKVLLKDGVESHICVVANTGNPDWGKKYTFKTYSELKVQALPNPEPIKLDEFKPIPMEGEVKNVTVSADAKIKVPVTRMFAKLVISFGNLADGMSPYSIEINSIPDYCRVESLGKGLTEGHAATYEPNTEWVTRSFNADSEDGKTQEYMIYVPENLQGESDNSGENDKGVSAPGKALVIKLIMKYKAPGSDTDSDLTYTVYPGGNTYNNFNIRRNNVYRIKININSANQDVHTPSSNCFVVKPGRGLSFEPYYRTETGGGYDFTDYLKADDTSEEKKKVIDRVQIIWQTKDAIGNNSGNPPEGCTGGDKVWYELNKKEPYHSKIYVKTNKEGNALIGAYNKDGEVIWSWHIWITDNDPGNVGNAIEYTTYRWDNISIKWNQTRVAGYAVMPCNLGALANEPGENNDFLRTYGTLYQWGRKDPFPGIMQTRKMADSRIYFSYSSENETNIIVYDNEHEQITIPKGSGKGEVKESLPVNRFESLLTTALADKDTGLKFSINNPTVFIAAAKPFVNWNFNNVWEYYNRGDWLPEGDECLWGATKRDENTLFLQVRWNPNGYIWANYGPDKSIFDPCPSGWRVPPGDLWLGFTNDGKNHVYNNSNANLMKYVNVPVRNGKPVYDLNYIYNKRGYWICLNGWQNPDKITFFPTQGSRIASGQCLLQGTCGNYHNATTDSNIDGLDRVNILHLHCSSVNDAKINIFEDGRAYSVKSVAGPIRCVRDRK